MSQAHPLQRLIDRAIAGELITSGKLNLAMAKQIRLAKKAGVPVIGIARACQVSRATVYDVLSGRTWKEKEEEP